MIDAAKSLGVKYWGFDFKNFSCVDDGVLEGLIDDIEKGGVFGGKDDVRTQTYAQFTQRRKNLSTSEYRKYSLSNMDKTLLQKIFPEKEYMRIAYGVKNNNIFSLIAAHIRRIVSIVGNILSGKKDFSQYAFGESKETTQQVKERIELFKKLDMVE